MFFIIRDIPAPDSLWLGLGGSRVCPMSGLKTSPLDLTY